MKFIASFIFLLSVCFSRAITPEETEISVAELHGQIVKVRTDAEKDSISDKMRALLITAFEDPATFDYPFDKFQFCKLVSPDHRLRLFNWNIPYNDGTHKYICFVLVWNKKDLNYAWTELQDNPREAEKIENRYLTADKWLGALYYEIIPMDKKNSDTYTLLGWDGKDKLTNRKIVDAVTIQGKKLRFGAGIYKMDDGTRKRLIYEYSDEVSASVKFFPKKKCIIIDHLSPKNAMMTGIYADYGPDGTYDMLQLKKGKWELLENIDVSQFTSDNDKPYVDPLTGRIRK
jgi:hypothetical protein